MRWGALLLLALPALADKPAPYYQRAFDKNQDAGATNRNLADITGRNRDRLVPVVGDQACAAGVALLGATEKGGYIFGGTCGGPEKLQADSMTLFALQNSTPTALFQIHGCSNCSPPKLVMSTGTAMGNWADLTGGAFK